MLTPPLPRLSVLPTPLQGSRAVLGSLRAVMLAHAALQTPAVVEGGSMHSSLEPRFAAARAASAQLWDILHGLRKAGTLGAVVGADGSLAGALIARLDSCGLLFETLSSHLGVKGSARGSAPAPRAATDGEAGVPPPHPHTEEPGPLSPYLPLPPPIEQELEQERKHAAPAVDAQSPHPPARVLGACGGGELFVPFQRHFAPARFVFAVRRALCPPMRSLHSFFEVRVRALCRGLRPDRRARM